MSESTDCQIRLRLPCALERIQTCHFKVFARGQAGAFGETAVRACRRNVPQRLPGRSPETLSLTLTQAGLGGMGGMVALRTQPLRHQAPALTAVKTTVNQYEVHR